MLFHMVMLLVVGIAAVMPLVVLGVVVAAVVFPVPLVVHLLVGLVLCRSGWGRGWSCSGGRSLGIGGKGDRGGNQGQRKDDCSERTDKGCQFFH